MGIYTGLRFKGIVKEQFRKDFEKIALFGEWEESNDEIFRKFGEDSRASFIPCGVLDAMPYEWEQAPYNEHGDGTATDGFDKTYDKNTGRWTFQCSLKNYEDTIGNFLKMVPYFIETVEHAEVFYEKWAYSIKYELVNEVMVVTDNKFIQYGYDD